MQQGTFLGKCSAVKVPVDRWERLLLCAIPSAYPRQLHLECLHQYSAVSFTYGRHLHSECLHQYQCCFGSKLICFQEW